MSSKPKHDTTLRDELNRLIAAGSAGDFTGILDIDNLPFEEREFALLFNRLLNGYKAAAEYDLVKYRLTNDAFGLAHWDMDVVDGDPLNPNSTFVMSQKFRQMLGFNDTTDFPDILASWSDRLHPDDKNRVLLASAAHLTDLTGQTPYDEKFRMLTKDGTYRWFHTLGATMRDKTGKPLRTAGAVEDITGRIQQREMLEKILDAMDCYIYVTDLETDEILFLNRKMKTDFGITKDIRGEKCWAHRQLGQTGRCPWCTKSRLIHNPNDSIAWEEENPISDNSLYNVDRIIEWPDGRKVHLQQSIDITEMKQAQKALLLREKMLDTLNRAALILLSRTDDAFEGPMAEGIALIAEVAHFDKISVFRNNNTPTGRRLSQIYYWKKDEGAAATLKELTDISYDKLTPRWEGLLEAGHCINGPVRGMPEADSLRSFAPVTVLAVPVFSDGLFWGFVLFEDLKQERYFTEDEVDMLRSASFMSANMVIRHEKAKQIREADEHAKLMLDVMPVGCSLWDSDLRCIDCNSAVVELFGMKDEQDFIDNFFEHGFPEYQLDGRLSKERTPEEFLKGLRDGHHVVDEYLHRKPDGTIVPAELTLVRVKDKDDYVLAVYTRDLREYNRMMREIERQHHLLQAVNNVSAIMLQADAETFHEALLRSMGALAEALDIDRVNVWKNRMRNGRLYVARIYDWSKGAGRRQTKDAAKERLYEDIMPGWGERLSRGACVNGIVREMDAGQQALLSPWGVRSLLMMPIFLKGVFWGFISFNDCRKERIFSANEETILRSASELIAEALIRNDMEENLRTTAACLQTAVTQAQAASSAKSEFLSHMSHEMRTPLNAVIGMTAIGRSAETIDKKDYAFEKIDDASKHLLGVINDILDMSKIEANKLELAPTEFIFDKMLQKVVNVVNFRVDERRQSLYINIDKNLPSAFIGDKQRLAQVITNLLSNAIKFTPEEGAIHLSADLLSEEDGLCRLQISVADNGIGLTDEHKKRLFRSFEQAEVGTSRKYGGTGLGLAISKRIVEMMGGKIWVESTPGKGAKFIFTALLKRSLKAPKRLLADGVNWRNIRLFALDDDPEIRNFFLTVASNLDIACDVAASGEDALAMLHQDNAYDIYFIDWKLPGINGIEFAQQVRDMLPSDSLVLLFSSIDWSLIETDARTAGINKFLPKPLFQSDIVDVINESLGLESAIKRGTTSDVPDDFSGRTILLAEDVEINREIVLALLEPMHVTIVCAEDGEQTLRIFEESPETYDMIFMDVQMPVMDGYEATQRIRALKTPYARKVPIIAMTANVFREDIERCLNAGMNAHIGKPLALDDVLSALRTYLGKK